MSKPSTERCLRYCDMFKECKRTECSRRAVLYPSGIKMVERNEWARWRVPELKRMYNELPLSPKENRIFIK